jgi:hypothetical protein
MSYEVQPTNYQGTCRNELGRYENVRRQHSFVLSFVLPLVVYEYTTPLH